MSDDNKPKEPARYEIPMMPIYGLDLGRELGSLDSRLARVESDVLELKRDQKEMEARLTGDIKTVDARVDKCLVAINRLDEHTRNLTTIGGGILIAVLAGLVMPIMAK